MRLLRTAGYQPRLTQAALHVQRRHVAVDGRWPLKHLSRVISSKTHEGMVALHFARKRAAAAPRLPGDATAGESPGEEDSPAALDPMRALVFTLHPHDKAALVQLLSLRVRALWAAGVAGVAAAASAAAAAAAVASSAEASVSAAHAEAAVEVAAKGEAEGGEGDAQAGAGAQ